MLVGICIFAGFQIFNARESDCEKALETHNEAMRQQVEELGENAIISDGVPIECFE